VETKQKQKLGKLKAEIIFHSGNNKEKVEISKAES